ncbi:uncharacterized protein TNCV_3588261 [Trichonephila clavipes]|nr:uncharacterized protein TNCV_3588261 [Trichonephila clavipes]
MNRYISVADLHYLAKSIRTPSGIDLERPEAHINMMLVTIGIAFQASITAEVSAYSEDDRFGVICALIRPKGVLWDLHWCAKIKDGVEKLAYQLNEEAERTERPIRRLSKVMYGSTCADMQVDVMRECLSSKKHVVGVRSVYLAKRLHAV